jgi:hypothetical protein
MTYVPNMKCKIFMFSCMYIRNNPHYQSFSQAWHFLYFTRHFLVPWSGGAFAPLCPFLCPTTEGKNGLLPQSQGPRTCIEQTSLTLKRRLKNKICWWAYVNLCCVWMFRMQFISNFTIRTLFWKAEIFKKMCSQNAGNAISETHSLKISWEGMPPDPRS